MSYRPQLQGDQPGPVTFPLRVFVHATDTLARQALRAALEADARLTPVDEINTAQVVIWDIGPATTSLPAASDLTRTGLAPASQALLVLVPDESAVPAALALGAGGVLQRRAHGPTLSAAVIAVRFGLCVLDVSFAEHCLTPAVPEEEPDRQASSIDALTHRELEVLEALALGLSNKVIADRLGVSIHTVKFHVNGILGKLQVDTRAGAVAKGLRNGLLRT